MKSKEQVDALAEHRYIGDKKYLHKKGAYVEGYLQCQKDNDWTKGCSCADSIGQTWCCNVCGLPYGKKKEQDWTDFEREILDWSRQLTQEQKYTPYPAQFLEWLKKNYKIPQKK